MLAIGLPAGFEFGVTAVYLAIVYSISRPFGAAAQAGFGIGMRVVQAGFMTVVALGFAVAPVAGQNFGCSRKIRPSSPWERMTSASSRWNCIASGLIFVSSMFQGLGKPIPSLATSAARVMLVAIPALVLSRTPGFQLRWIWSLSAGSVFVQLTLGMWLLRRELGRRLDFAGTHLRDR